MESIETKVIVGFSRYTIDKQGRIFNTRLQKYMQPRTDKAGYKDIGLTSDEGKLKKFFIHRLIALYFIDNPKNKPCINHINGIKDDNRLENLQWCTKQENTIHAVNVLKKEIGAKGIKNHNSKNYELNSSNLQDILVLINTGTTIEDISKIYHIRKYATE